MTKKEHEWNTLYLPNIPLYSTVLNQDIVDRLWRYIDKAKHSYNHGLAGNIEKSLSLHDEDDFFMKNVVGPIADLYVNNVHGMNWIQNNHSSRCRSLVMNKFWVNFQNKHEFNPIHNHSGLISFVVWMKIPTNSKDQHALPICDNSNSPSASDFQFTFSDILGNHQDFRLLMDDTIEGRIIVFPGQLRHQVYPFYECDEKRISISGNICWNSTDLDW